MRINHNDQDQRKISVVIATLGGDMLSDTISILNKGSIRPDEILICIPEKFKNAVPRDLPKNVRLVITGFMGQVSQRIAGFKEVKNSFVFQMDDDVHLDSRALEILKDGISELGEFSSISPALINRSTNQSVYKNSRISSLASMIYYFCISGSVKPMQGSILGCGIGLGYSPVKDDPTFMPTEWVPGGCVMHNSVNLIYEEFYPFQGKAFCEDLIHSYLLTKNGVKLFIAKNATASIIVDDPCIFDIKHFLLYLTQDFRARNYFLSLKKLPKFRMLIFYFLQVLIYLQKKSKFKRFYP